MININISKQILTVGCAYHKPKGGVAQVLYNYKQYVFPQFKSVINSGGGKKWYKLLKAIGGLCLLGILLILDRNIKIVHIHTASYNSFRRSAWYVKLSKLLGRKVILHMHGGGFKEYYETNPRWISSVLNACDAIITLSESWKKYYHTITYCKNIFIVENIVALPKRTQIKKETLQLHLLFLGLITEPKGIFDLLETLHSNFDRLHGKVVLHIGGDGKVDELNKWICEYKMEDMIIYEGWVSGDRKAEIFSRSDVFVLPSYMEGLPVSILEAMSYGLPIISTPVGGIPEIVQQNVNGFLVPPGDRESLASAIILLENDKKRRREMGDESYRLLKPYLPGEVVRKLEEIYIELLY